MPDTKYNFDTPVTDAMREIRRDNLEEEIERLRAALKDILDDTSAYSGDPYDRIDAAHAIAKEALGDEQ